MFEIRKRQKPVFRAADVRRIGEVMDRVLGLTQLDLPDVEIVPIFQTARINEVNAYTVRSAAGAEAAADQLVRSPAVARLKDLGRTPDLLIARMIAELEAEFSDYGVGLLAFDGAGPPAGAWTPACGSDHPAIWKDGVPVDWLLAETDAFFAVSPALRIEIALNRYRVLESFGPFSIGLVRF